jgi:phenylalanyl-tRNA synthetase beta chain
MKISYKWLKEILDFKLDPHQTSALLTDIGLEVEREEEYENIKGGLQGLIVGEVKSVEKHPNADRLSITQIDLGENENFTIVCGAPNVKKGQKVVVAKPGTTIFPKNNSSFKIKNTKIRGQESFGMICAEDEIGLGDGHDGILVLDKDANIGDSASNYFNVFRDTIFEIGLTPNRADAMSHYGVARDLLAALKFKKLLPSSSALKAIPEKSQIVTKKNIEINISIENSVQCQRYTGIVIKNIQVKPSPKWLKDILESIGIKPINNIVDVTNYVLHNFGQPLHAFDLDKIIGKEIIVRSPKDQTLFTTLDGQERKLDKEDIMICNSKKEMCLAGVFGGLESGVTEKTKSIFIESALFNPVLIRKTAKRHGLNTDASFRYERGVDPSMVLPALIQASRIITDLSGGEIASEILDVHLKETEDISFEINFEKIRKIGGIDLDNKTITELLTYLEIKVGSIKSNKALVNVPAYRNDVNREIDIAEEVLRIYGYNNIEIPEKINSSPSIPKLKTNHSIQQKISNHLVSLGCYEIMNNSLVKREYGNFLDEKSNNHISLLNPLSNDTATLRKSLIYGAVEVLKFNHFNGNPNGNIFEWGKVYSKNGNKFGQENRLLVATTGLQNEEHWFNGKLESSFFQLKGIIESVFKSLGVYYEIEMLRKNHLWEEGLSFKKGKHKLATIGTVRKEISNLIGFKKHYFISEIYFDSLMKIISDSKPKIKPINKFQKVFRDLSVLINEEVTMQEITSSVNQINSKLLKKTTLFDIYRDKKNIDQKAYGLRFEFLHSERTLKDKEVDSVMNSIQVKLKGEFNAILR